MKFIKSMTISALIVFLITSISCDNRASSDIFIKVPAGKNVSSYYIKVTGPGMDTLERRFDATDTIVIDVPAGENRLFEVIAYIKLSDPGAVTSYRGTATVDLKAGVNTSLPMSMIAHGTKLVIPDYSNDRIVQINDINGADWKETDLGYGTSFNPYDIDFDAKGRIYVARNLGVIPSVVWIDDINDTTPTLISNVINITSIANDRINNYIYYAASPAAAADQLYRNSADGGSEVTRTTTNVDNISGIDVDENGFLYIACTLSSVASVVKYDPVNQNVVASYSTGFNTSWDVVVKPPYVYVANYENDRTSNNKIYRFTMDLQSPLEISNNPNNTSDTFYGPHRFVAVRNDQIILIDEAHDPASPYNLDRIVSLDDIVGSNWNTFGSYGNGTNEFYFYDNYFC